MLKYLIPFLILALPGCEESDPLVVERITVDEAAQADGLAPTEPSGGAEWNEADGVRTATGPATLELLPDHGALTAAFSFRMSEGARAELLLDGRYSLSLPTLALDSAATPESVGSPRAGIWQNIEIAYLPAGERTPPLLVACYLNDNLVYYQQPLTGDSTAAEGGLRLEVLSGDLSITNFRTHDQAGKSSRVASNGEVELNMPLIHYAYYDLPEGSRTFADWEGTDPAKEGFISRFDLGAIREKGRDYAIRFEGDLDVPEAGEYTFFLRSPALTSLYIDGEEVTHLGDDTEGIDRDATVTLSEGTHRVRLDHVQQTGWNHLLLKYAHGGERRWSLNDMPEGRAVATPRSREALIVETDDRPYLLRSFLNFPNARIYDYTQKRTHVINVGEAEGPHYSYDLQTGALLQVWRGGFVDASEMWNDRGEPQVVRALGPAIFFDGRPQWAEAANAWPDSAQDLRHRRYELDDAGRPTFFFNFGTAGEVSDRLLPTPEGLERTLTNGTDEELLTTVAAASNIRETAPGTFELVNPGVNVSIMELASGGLRLLAGEGTQRLVARLPPGEHLTYTMNW